MWITFCWNFIAVVKSKKKQFRYSIFQWFLWDFYYLTGQSFFICCSSFDNNCCPDWTSPICNWGVVKKHCGGGGGANHLTLSLWIKVNISQFQNEEAIFEEWGRSRVTKHLITRMNKKLAPLWAKSDVTHALQLKLQERMNKKWLWRHMVVIKILTTK